ncbi:MAG: hypothetical protein GY838_09985 [bacterium]|nr:hypothetical protein [bacterium]
MARILITVGAGALSALFVWGIGWPGSWFDYLDKAPTKAIMFVNIWLMLSLFGYVLYVFRFPRDTRQMASSLSKGFLGIAAAAGGLPFSINLVSFMATRSGHLAGDLQFSALDGGAVVVIVFSMLFSFGCLVVHYFAAGRAA